MNVNLSKSERLKRVINEFILKRTNMNHKKFFDILDDGIKYVINNNLIQKS